MDVAENEFINHNEPIYLLSLDGGGVRGISEAVILHDIMTRIQKELGLENLPKPCDYFHLIGGTSTGGLIAIMLGRLRMSTEEVLDQYNSISKKIFRRKNKRLFKTSFKEKALEQAVKDVANPRVNGNPHMAQKGNSQKGHSFVVSLRTGTDDENTPYIFRSYECRGEKTECQIWEAARATTAATLVFKPAKIRIGIEEGSFVDGAVKWNNPSRQVLSEAEAFFGPHRRLGCIVSLGTGIRPPTLDGKEKGQLGSFSEATKMAKDYLTDPEPAHLALKALLKDHINSYFRFSIPAVEGEEKVRIFEYKKMDSIRLATERYLERRDVSQMLDQLVGILCHKESTDLMLGSVCHADSAETSLKNITHHLEKRPVTSPNFTGRKDILRILDHVFPMPPAPQSRKSRRG